MDWIKFIEALTPEERQELGNKLIGYLPTIITESRTDIYTWITLQDKISKKLCTVLALMAQYWPEYKYIEQINKHDFLKCRGAGKLLWEELVGLRGY